MPEQPGIIERIEKLREELDIIRRNTELVMGELYDIQLNLMSQCARHHDNRPQKQQ